MPAAVSAVARGGVLRLIWANEVGGLTFELESGDRHRFVKWAPASSGIDLADEAARMAWARAFVAVAEVLDQGANEDGSWIVTTVLPGENAITDRWKAHPAAAVTAIGRGLRALHDALPTDSCPFSWSAHDRLAEVRQRALGGGLDPGQWEPCHQQLAIDEALGLLSQTPEPDRIVVCHGDACAPNTILTDKGQVSGYVDLGDLGVADRWADLAIATWSTIWNYGPGWEDHLLAAYGVDTDPHRTRYYRLLWDLGP